MLSEASLITIIFVVHDYKIFEDSREKNDKNMTLNHQLHRFALAGGENPHWIHIVHANFVPIYIFVSCPPFSPPFRCHSNHSWLIVLSRCSPYLCHTLSITHRCRSGRPPREWSVIPAIKMHWMFRKSIRRKLDPFIEPNTIIIVQSRWPGTPII